METQRVLEEVHRQMGALCRETQWTAGAFSWRPRRLQQRVEMPMDGSQGLQLAGTIEVIERVRATPDRARHVLASLEDGRDRYVFDSVARRVRSRAVFELGGDGDDLGCIARALLQQVDEAERDAPQLARVLAGRIPISRSTRTRARHRCPPPGWPGCGAAER